MLLGSDRGRFLGNVFNTAMPLCAEDFWGESNSRTIRTWHRDRSGYRFYPYTQSDLRTVTRCGFSTAELYSGHEISVSRSGDGLTLTGFSVEEVDRAFNIMKSYQIGIVREDGLLEYVDPTGYFTY